MAKKRKAKAASGGAGKAAAEEKTAGTAPWIRFRAWMPAALFLLLSLAYFSEVVLSGRIVFGHDVGTDYHRGKEPLAEKIATFQQPAWSGHMGGFPRSEEIRPQYFPTRLIYLFTTYQRHLAWRYVLTMFLAGLAFYAYLRVLGVGRGAATWGGVAYMSAPTFLSFPYAGHYAKMGVIALWPLMCLLLERGMRQGRPIHFAGLGILIALGIYSPHLQMLYFALWGLGFYFLYKLAVLYREGPDLRLVAGRSGLFALAVALGLGLGAEGLLPSYLYTKTESKRAAGTSAGSGKSAAEQLQFARSWSLHPEEVASLVVPEFGGYDSPREGRRYWGRNGMKINSEYFGIGVLLLALLLVPEARRRPPALFMGFLFVFALAYALGPYTPVHWVFYHFLPGVKVLRAPAMIAFLFAFPACVLAAMGLDRVLRGDGESAVPVRRVLVAGGVLTALALLLALAPRAITEVWTALFYGDIAPRSKTVLTQGHSWLARGALCVALVSAACTLLLCLNLRRKLAAGLVIAGLAALTLFDTWRIDRLFLKYENPAQHRDIRAENPRTREFLASEGGQFRVLPLPDYNFLRRPGFHLYGVELATGFHDFTPRRYDRLLRELAPVEHLLGAKYYEGRSIPASDAELLERVHPLLNLLNVRYIAVPGGISLESERFPQVFAAENFRLYENPDVLPRFYLAPEHQVVEEEEEVVSRLLDPRFDPGHTAILERSPPAPCSGSAGGDPAGDRIERLDYDPAAGHMRLEIRNAGPRILVVSQNFHPNWRLFVDGRSTELFRANYAWTGACLPAGEHTVELRYTSWTVRLSRWTMTTSLAALAAVVLWEWRARRRVLPHRFLRSVCRPGRGQSVPNNVSK